MVILRPGENLIAKAAGDTVRWVLGESVQGAGPNPQVVVLIKPILAGQKSNGALTTGSAPTCSRRSTARARPI
jgi:type IV secretory pathway VirB9-like protein